MAPQQYSVPASSGAGDASDDIADCDGFETRVGQNPKLEAYIKRDPNEVAHRGPLEECMHINNASLPVVPDVGEVSVWNVLPFSG